MNYEKTKRVLLWNTVYIRPYQTKYVNSSYENRSLLLNTSSAEVRNYRCILWGSCRCKIAVRRHTPLHCDTCDRCSRQTRSCIYCSRPPSLYHAVHAHSLTQNPNHLFKHLIWFVLLQQKRSLMCTSNLSKAGETRDSFSSFCSQIVLFYFQLFRRISALKCAPQPKIKTT